MLIYALGRGLEHYDRPTVERIVKALAGRRLQVLGAGDADRPERPVSAAARDMDESESKGTTLWNSLFVAKSYVAAHAALRGIGVSLSLPWLEAMGPLTAWAENVAPPRRSRPIAWPSSTSPTARTWPTGRRSRRGPTSSCRRSSNRSPAVKDELLVLTGLTADKARPHGDGGGDHARALAAFLTGAQPRKTDGTDIRAGISVDQVAAARVGEQTRLPSLEIGCEPGAMAGNCDSGYSCVYSSTMSWRSATQPLPKEVNPKLVFERLFAAANDPAQGQARRAAEEHPRFRPRGREEPRKPARRQRPAQARRVLHVRSATSSCASSGPRSCRRSRRPTTPRRRASRPSTRSTSA